jgi:endonuclease-3
MLHGQRVCLFKNPACERCVLLELCPTGQARMEGRTAAARTSVEVVRTGPAAKRRLL